jgi:hypothetical protein
VVLEQFVRGNVVQLAQATVTILDGIPPVIAALTPVQGETYPAEVIFTATGSDNFSGMESIHYRLDSGIWQPLALKNAVTGEYGASWLPSAADNGLHTVSFQGTDKAGNTSAPIFVAFIVHHDATPPILTLSTLADGSFTTVDLLNITGTVTDNTGVRDLTINGASVPFTADGTFSLPLVLKPGANHIEIKAVDLAGNQTTATRTITLDQSAPALTISTPADNSKTAVALVDVAGTVDETSIVTVKLGNTVQTAAMNGTAFTSVVTLASGSNTIEITATDLAGNAGSQKRSVLFDDQKPSLAVTEPAQDIRTNRSSLTVSGTASDPYTAVGVTVTLGGTILTPSVVNGIFSQVVAFGAEKLYPITVIATNEVGTQTAVQRNVIYDTTPPTLTIDSVATPTTSPNQMVTGTREDGTVVAVTCATATLGTIEYPTATTWRASLAGLQPGVNRLQAEVSDLAGNRTTASATILYVPKAPDVTIGASPNQLWPPNKKLVPVTIDGNVTTYGSDIKEVTISVADEYGTHNRQGLKFGDTILLEAWRNGNDKDGRVYTITAVVTDQAGNRTTKATTVIVPHDTGK